jgi:hypothetical protein
MNPVVQKAKRLLSQRGTQMTVAHYLRLTAGWHLVMAALFWLVISAAWWTEMPSLALFMGGFWAGRLVRDIQWYRKISAEWESSLIFIDWQKVETIASAASNT